MNQHLAQQPVVGQNQEQSTFIAPRAKSRKGDAHIRIEVHKDERIIHHLQGQEEHLENMNLLFYNFNDFNNLGPTTRMPTAAGTRDRVSLVSRGGP